MIVVVIQVFKISIIVFVLKMKVTAVVPVYNEEKTIGSVLKVLTSSKKIDRIIVVNSGSTDNTADIIKKFNVRIITLKTPIGKGGAVKEAANYIKSGIVFMCDGDLHNFKKEHIEQILEPLENGQASMCIGIRKNPIISGYFIDTMILTGGERAVFHHIFKEAIKNPLILGWGLESVLNYYCKKNNYRIATVNLKGVTHTLRSKKKSWWSFFAETREVIAVRIKLFFNNF